jgi:glutathione S-transferase
MAPDEYKALHPLGTAPIITDGELVLGESGAIADYLIATYGDGRLSVKCGQPEYADYLYWFHFANGSLQPIIMQVWSLERLGLGEDNAALQRAHARFELIFSALDKRLNEVRYLAGLELTAADIMTVFSLTTMRVFKPYDLSRWPNVLAYLNRIGARPQYRTALSKAELGVES